MKASKVTDVWLKRLGTRVELDGNSMGRNKMIHPCEQILLLHSS